MKQRWKIVMKDRSVISFETDDPEPGTAGGLLRHLQSMCIEQNLPMGFVCVKNLAFPFFEIASIADVTLSPGS